MSLVTIFIGVWRSYAAVDSRVIEAAHQNSEDEVSLNALGRTYIVDFLSMKQINEDTGTTRPVQRRLGPSPAPSPASPQTNAVENQSIFYNNKFTLNMILMNCLFIYFILNICSWKCS